MDIFPFVKILAIIELGNFSIADYAISKMIDVGSGKLWIEIKKQFQSKPKSIERQLYDAIEESVVEFSGIKDIDYIAPVCEAIYVEWIKNKKLTEECVERALCELECSKANIHIWYRAFYNKVIENDLLYRWYVMQTISCNSKYLGRFSKLEEQLDEVFIDKGDKRSQYEQILREQILQSILEEPVSLHDIYIPLHGKLIMKNIPNPERATIINIMEYISGWYNEDLSILSTVKSHFSSKTGHTRKIPPRLFLHGEPGSGKSSVLKTIAASMLSTNLKQIVVFINLRRLPFLKTFHSLGVLEAYMKNNFPWFFENKSNEMRLLILDGLDEIKYNVYETAMELVRGLEGCTWSFPWKLIVGGRTSIIQKVIEEIRCVELEILPLFFTEKEQEEELKQTEDPADLIKIDLRSIYWKKLMHAFQIKQKFTTQSIPRFDDLSNSPLIMFLIAWTIKNTDVQFDKLKNAAELYETIFRWIYTREYNREDLDDIHYSSNEYAEYQQMIHDLGGCAYCNNARSVSMEEISSYCTKMKREELCKNWLGHYEESNLSKLSLFFFLREGYDEEKIDKLKIEFTHKTFYEYLAAASIIEFLFRCSIAQEKEEFLPRMFYMFSNNLINSEIAIFICEIVENENIRINNKIIIKKEWENIVHTALKHYFNVDYPIVVGDKKSNSDKIFVDSYLELKNKVEIYEKNIQTILDILVKAKPKWKDSILKDKKDDLSYLKLNKAKMPCWNFGNTTLMGGYFNKAYLSGAFLINVCCMKYIF